MTYAKRIISITLIIMTLCSIFGITGITVSAATTSQKSVVSYNAVAGGTISNKTYGHL